MTISVVLPLSLAGIVACATPASAAVRICGELMTGDKSEAPTEIAAKTKTLAVWTERAEAAGFKDARWQLAYDRRLDCKKQSQGSFQCEASAKPCRIEQRLPSDAAPLKKRQGADQ